MTQTEAVIEALKILGGKAHLKYITAIALLIEDTDWTNTKTPDASIRRIVRNTPQHILPLGNGQYELLEYKSQIKLLENRCRNLEDTICQLRLVPTKEQFVSQLLKEVMLFFKHDRKKADPFRQILRNLNQNKAEQALDKWMEEETKHNGHTINNYNAPIQQQFNKVDTVNPLITPKQ